MKSLRSSDPARPMDITQSYRSDDPVQNLKVRVTLRCIAGAFQSRPITVICPCELACTPLYSCRSLTCESIAKGIKSPSLFATMG